MRRDTRLTSTVGLIIAGTICVTSLAGCTTSVSSTQSPSPNSASTATPAASQAVVESPSSAVSTRPTQDVPSYGPTPPESPTSTAPAVTLGPTSEPDDPNTSAATWRLIGQIDVLADDIEWATAFDAGYVVTSAYGHPVRTWFSTTGSDWRKSSIGGVVTPCPGWTARPDTSIEQALTLGDRVLLLGSVFDQSTTRCEDEWEGSRAAAWISTDGVSWQEVDQIYPDKTTVRTRWPYKDGWLGIGTRYPDDGAPGESVVLSSGDGLSWDVLTGLGNDVAPNDQEPFVHGAALADTTVIVTSQTINDPTAPDGQAVDITVWRSDDAIHWKEVAAPFSGIHRNPYREMPYVTQLIAPSYWIDPPSLLSPEASPWLFVVQAVDGDFDAKVWSTIDLERWDSADFPRPAVDFVVPTNVGLIAQGRVECQLAGAPCPPERQRQYVSTDGARWLPLDPRLTGWVTVIRGADTALLIGNNSGRVWYLETHITGP